MKIKSVLVACLILILFGTARGYDEDQAANNYSHELVECAAYYDIGAEGARRTGHNNEAIVLKNASDKALDIARKYSRDDVISARYDMAIEDQIKLINGNYANLSLLIVKYKDICKKAIEDPINRLNYWKQKK